MKINQKYRPLDLDENKRIKVPFIVYIPFIVLYWMYHNQPYNAPVIGQFWPTPTVYSLSMSDALLTVTNMPKTITPTNSSFMGVLPSYGTVTLTPLGHPAFFYSLPVWYRSQHEFLFSYYYPPLGGVNCHPDNWINNTCKDTTASGQKWSSYMGAGIAIHPDWLDEMPYGTQIIVSSPSEIAGTYTVIDLCGGCLINGNYYFDFLEPSMPSGLSWSVPVRWSVIRVGWDNSFPPTSTPAPLVLASSTSLPTITPWVVTATPVSTIVPTYTFYPTYTLPVVETLTPEPTLTEVPSNVP